MCLHCDGRESAVLARREIGDAGGPVISLHPHDGAGAGL